MEKNELVSAYINKAASPQKEIMTALRDLIAESVPGVKEALKWGQPVYAKTNDFCYLKAAKSHVNLGFMDFQNLNDPEGLLEGTGKTMRHIKLKSLNDLKPGLFSTWLITAAG